MTMDELLAAIAEDPAAHLVYADALEDRGQLAEAEVVRLVHALETATDDALLRARELLAKAEGMPRAWLRRLGRSAPLEDTCWGSSVTADEMYYVKFRADGGLEFRQGSVASGDTVDESGLQPSGHWMQIGRAVYFVIVVFSLHEGVIIGDRIAGLGSNTDNAGWRFELEPISAEEFAGSTYSARSVGDTDARAECDDADRIPVRSWPHEPR